MTISSKKKNKEKSLKMYTIFKSIIKPQRCYDNVYLIFFDEKFDAETYQGWKIAFGYFGNASLFLKRHCYFICPEGDVVDPTAALYEELGINNDGNDYFTFKEYTLEEYGYTARYGSDMYPTFKQALREDEKEFYKWAVENQIAITGQDYEEYLASFDKSGRIKALYPEDFGFTPVDVEKWIEGHCK